MLIPILPLLLLAAAAPDIEEFQRGERLHLRLRSTAQANLTWQLDTLAGRTLTAPKDYEDLWKHQLAWSGEDARQLANWKSLSERYRRQPPGRAAPRTHYPANYGRFYAASLNADYDFRIAGLEAPLNDDSGRALRASYQRLCRAAACADQFAAILAHFRPRFLAWWQSEGAATGAKLLARLSSMAAERRLVSFFEEIAALTRARLPRRRHTISLHLVVHPKDYLTNLTATVMNSHLLMEVVEDPEVGGARLGTFAHELTHHFYDYAPRRAHLRLIDRFLARPEPYSMAAYSILNEGLACAAQVLWEKRSLPPADFTKFMAKDDNIYQDPFISQAGRALAPVIERRIAAGQTIHDEAFVAEYMEALGAALGPARAASPRFLLSSRAVIRGEAGRAAADYFRAHVRGIASFDEWKDLARAPHLGAVVLLTPPELAQLRKNSAGLLAPPDLAAIEEEAAAAGSPRGQPFAYAAPRSAKASIYVLYAPDSDSLLALMRRFAASDTPFTGLRRFHE